MLMILRFPLYFGHAQLNIAKNSTALEMGNRENFFLSYKDILLSGKVLVFSLESELIGKSIYLTFQKKKKKKKILFEPSQFSLHWL